MKKRSIIAAVFALVILILSNKYWLNIHFEFYEFIIILVLSYLLTYKLVDYIADFKTIKEKSRIEIIFLVIFFICLFLPMSIIDKSEISRSENRTLAKWQSLITKDGKINYNFGKSFDNWYNDRFFLRKPMVKGFNLLKYSLAINYFENSKGFVNKKNHWVSSKYGLSNHKVTQKEKDLIVSNINKLKDFCDKRGIKFYIVIVPRKEEICAKNLYPVLKNVSMYGQTKDVIDYVKDKTGYEIIYPYKELEKLQMEDAAYFKTDHHWTDEGAYLGYLKLMGQIKKDFPNIKISSRNDFNYKYANKVKVAPYMGYHNGITYKNLNLHDKKLLDRKYKYFYHKKFDYMKYAYDPHVQKQYHVFTYNNVADGPNLVLYGDSFTLNLLPILPTSFKNTVSIYSYMLGDNLKTAFKIKRFEKYILKNNPKILVITLCEIQRLEHLF